MENNTANETTKTGPDKPLYGHQRIADRDANVERVACGLAALARRRLPDFCLTGRLAGHEADIRQDAVMMALEWYRRSRDPKESKPKYDWNAPRALNGAVAIQIRIYWGRLTRRAEGLRRFAEHRDAVAIPSASPRHPASVPCGDWPSPVLRGLLARAIEAALDSRRISNANARVATAVLVDQIPVANLARKLNVSHSAIYQHLARVKREIPDIIDGIEVPFARFL